MDRAAGKVPDTGVRVRLSADKAVYNTVVERVRASAFESSCAVSLPVFHFTALNGCPNATGTSLDWMQRYGLSAPTEACSVASEKWKTGRVGQRE